MKRLLLATTVLAVGAFANSTANADIIGTALLTSDHCTGLCGPQDSFGTVQVTDNGAGTLTFDVSLNNGNKWVSTGFPLSFGFSLNGDPTITYTGLNTAIWDVVGTATNVQTAGSYGLDGFGTFEYGVTCTICNGGSNPQSVDLTFSITGSSTLSLASFQLSVNPPGDTQAFFAADIISGLGGVGNTGLVDASVLTVPGPVVGAGLPGLAGLLMLGLARMRRTREWWKRVAQASA
jgi:hypothetical protein